MDYAISPVFSEPLVPGLSIVGLHGEDGRAGQFRSLLTRAFQHIFHVEFMEQFIAEGAHLRNQGRVNALGTRTHAVKESWMAKMRTQCALLADFRLLDASEDTALVEQIVQTRNCIPPGGPVYMAWLGCEGRLSSQRLAALLNSRLDKNCVVVVDLSADTSAQTDALKAMAQQCLELTRIFYRNLAKRYKALLAAEPTKFLQPWMAAIYYYTKLAVVEEFRGDLQSALKYHHSILAKCKQMIEDARDNARMAMISFLRPSADLSFLLFRLGQAKEAEFGLFRYLAYFGRGLVQSDLSLWRYNLAREFAGQLAASAVWNPQLTLEMHGQTHFLMFALLMARQCLKADQLSAGYQLQEQMMQDVAVALQACTPALAHTSICLQLMVIEQHCRLGGLETAQLYADHLKKQTVLSQWPLLDNRLRVHSLALARQSQDYATAIVDCWTHRNAELDELCMLHYQMCSEPARLDLSVVPNRSLYCCVRFLREAVRVFDECEVELGVLNVSGRAFEPESIGVFFSDDQIDPVVFDVAAAVFAPQKETVLRACFPASKPTCAKVGFVTMQLKRPWISLQYASSLLGEPHDGWSLASTTHGLSFLRRCALSSLTVRVDALRPSLEVELKVSDTVLVGVPTAIRVRLVNRSLHPVVATTEAWTSGGEQLNGAASESSLLLMPGETGERILYGTFSGVSDVTVKIASRFDVALADAVLTDACELETRTVSVVPVSPFEVSVEPVIVDVIRDGAVYYVYDVIMRMDAIAVAFSLAELPVMTDSDGVVVTPLSAGLAARIGGSLEFVFRVSRRTTQMQFAIRVSVFMVERQWTLTLPFQPAGLFIWTTCAERGSVMAPLRVTWHIWNGGDRRLEAFAVIDSTTRLLFVGMKQTRLVVEPGSCVDIAGEVLAPLAGAYELPRMRVVDTEGGVHDYETPGCDLIVLAVGQ